eukprot:superscaffoldBa00002066_g13058
MAPVHSSTPMPSQPSWAEVVHCGRRRDLVKGRVSPPPPFTLSNRFISLMDEAPVHPGDAPADPPASEPADPTPAPPVTAASPPPVASAERAGRCSMNGNKRCRMLQEAVIRRSGNLPRAESPRSCPPAQTLPPEQLSSQKECPLPSPGRSHTSPPRPLIPPTTLIIGDSITSDIRFINAITNCFPAATLPVLAH